MGTFIRLVVYVGVIYWNGWFSQFTAYLSGTFLHTTFGFGENMLLFCTGLILGIPFAILESGLSELRDEARAKEAEQARQAELERQNREDQERERQHQLKLAEKRRELELEYEHVKKIAMLQSSIDQGKLDKLAEMQNALKNAKSEDLDTMRQQIEAMRGA